MGRRDSAASESGPTPTPPKTPRWPGATAPEGIGLARTEHMFIGERLQVVQRVILSTDPTDREEALGDLEASADRGFRGPARGDGRAARGDPAARPAAPRVPALPSRDGAGDAAAGSGPAVPSTTCRRCPTRSPVGGGQPDAGPARGPARADASTTCTGCRLEPPPMHWSGGSRPAATPPRDHDPPGRRRRGADPDAGDDRDGDRQLPPRIAVWNWRSPSGR